MCVLISDKSIDVTNRENIYDFLSYTVTEVRNSENKIISLYAQTKSSSVPMIFTVINNDETILNFEIDFETFNFIFENSNFELEKAKQEAVEVVSFMDKLLIAN